jgi:uncharacterized membrane protein required for colicin V production
MLACVIRGTRRGMLRILFGIVAWVFLLCFINFGSDFATNYIMGNTDVPGIIQQNIDAHLHERYNESEGKEPGTGNEAILGVVPSTIKDTITTTIQESIDQTISLIAEELSRAAIKGISTILCVVLGILLIYLLDKLIKAIGFVPGVRDVNRLLGFIAGFIEGMLIVWLIMYIADCFPASALGRFVAINIDNDQILKFIYENNIIEQIIGI